MSLYGRERGYDIFDDEDSDSDIAESSSEDEINIILHGTPEQRRKLQHLHRKQQLGRNKGRDRLQVKDTSQADSSSEDEFEKEMNAELNKNVKCIEDARDKPSAIQSASLPHGSGEATDRTNSEKPMCVESTEKFYDEVYFDSDEEETNGVGANKKQKHSVISNDDLLYDPNMDEEDQKWVDQQRSSHRSRGGKKEKRPDSDALLDCPACLTTLCIDCQRHETYKHQFRAMFVMNCVVDSTETLQCPEQAPKKKKKKSVVTTPGSSSSSDLFNPVRCTECNTVVGVFDADEVYHFFNVLASHT